VGNLRAQIKKEEVDFEYMATVTAQKGKDCCLWNMAEKYYGDPYLWNLIKEKNKISNERKIPVGTVIYIPTRDAKELVAKTEGDMDKISANMSELEEELAAARKEAKNCKAEKAKLSKALEDCKAKGKKSRNC
jgi:hypothetical protein